MRNNTLQTLIIRHAGPVVAAAAVVMTLAACQPAGDSATTAQPAPPKVKIAQPLSQEVSEWDEFTGRVEAVKAVEVRARVGGYLEKVNFKAGASVQQGDLLFVIDPRPFRAQLAYAQAELERAKARREQANNDWLRAQRLFQGKGISVEERDARGTGLLEAQAAVNSALANVASAKLNLEFTEVRAPIAGRIGREQITEGNLVTGEGADATLLTFIVATDPVYVYADADERAVLKYRHQAVAKSGGGYPDMEAALADERGFPHRGKLAYISPREDPATGTVSLRGEFANPDGLLAPGLFARVRVRGGAPYRALLVPERAVATDQAQRFVWVINQKQQAEYRKVTLGARIGQQQVITDGLKAGEWLVVEGQQKLKPGLPVEPERLPAAATEEE